MESFTSKEVLPVKQGQNEKRKAIKSMLEAQQEALHELQLPSQEL